MCMILHFSKYFMSWFGPQIVDIVEILIETFNCNPLNHNPFEYKRRLQHSAENNLRICRTYKNISFFVLKIIYMNYCVGCERAPNFYRHVT